MASSMFATNHNIFVSLDGSNNIVYNHGAPQHGAHGHEFVVDGDNIKWKCDPSKHCDSVTVQFKGTSPCTALTSSSNESNCTTISTGNIDLALYPYSITVTYNGHQYPFDPDVIVDNGSISTKGLHGDKDKKPTPKKK